MQHISLLTKVLLSQVHKRTDHFNHYEIRQLFWATNLAEFPLICGFNLELETLLDVCVCAEMRVHQSEKENVVGAASK